MQSLIFRNHVERCAKVAPKQHKATQSKQNSNFSPSAFSRWHLSRFSCSASTFLLPPCGIFAQSELSVYCNSVSQMLLGIQAITRFEGNSLSSFKNRGRETLTLSIVEIDLRYGCLNQGPDAPVQTWHTAIAVHFLLQERQRGNGEGAAKVLLVR